MQLTDHYKAVRARLNAGRATPPPAPKPPDRIEPPKPPDLTALMAEAHVMMMDRSDMPVWQRIIRDVCQKHGVTRDQLNSKRKTANLLPPRQEAYYRLREAGYSLKRIAILMGGRDHTTVLHGAKIYAERNRIPMPTVPRRADNIGSAPRGTPCASCPFVRSDETRG